MANRKWESVIIFILIGIAVIFLWPILQKIFIDSRISSVKSSTEAIVRSVEILYENYSLRQEVSLPFSVEFIGGSKYDVYERSDVITHNLFLENRGEKPTSGRIIIDTDGAIYARNVEYKNIICNMEKNKVVKCAFKH